MLKIETLLTMVNQKKWKNVKIETLLISPKQRWLQKKKKLTKIQWSIWKLKRLIDPCETEIKRRKKKERDFADL